MTTIKGHLTATEKKAITAILNAGLTSGKVNRKIYFISQKDNVYNVAITENMTNWCELTPRLTTNHHSFTL